MLFSQWPNLIPPKEWDRVLAVDVGGSTPWAWLWAAIDPQQNIIFYDEIYETTSDAGLLVGKAKPKMLDEDNQPYKFRAKVIDYENKIAAEDLRRGGIPMTNARKHDKAASINRLRGYFHPNPKHHFPEWHPKAGDACSPRAFVMRRCRNFIREIPQARWLEKGEYTRDEMDRRTGNHAIDCALYIIRELPPPYELKPSPPMYAASTSNISKASELYWYDVKNKEAEKSTEGRRPYRLHRSAVLHS